MNIDPGRFAKAFANTRDIDADASEIERMEGASRRALWLLAVLVFGLFGLAAFLPIEGAVMAQGQVAVDSRVKIITHPTGGVLSAVTVREGQHVAAGATLMRLDQTVLGPSARNANQSRNQLLAQSARLEAERDNAGRIAFPAELTRSADPDADAAMRREQRQFQLVRAEQSGTLALLNQRIRQYREEIRSYRAQIDATRRQQALIEPELAGLRSLKERGLVTINRLNEMERTAVDMSATQASLDANIAQVQARISETQEQILNVAQRSRVEAATELSAVVAALAEQDTRAAQLGDQLDRSVITAPQAGIVGDIVYTTIGSAIPAGEPVAQIVPDDDALVVTAQVGPGDVDALTVGQVARVRLSSLDRELSPEIAGRLVFIAPERTQDPDSGISFYRVRVAVDEAVLKQAVGGADLRAGVPVEVFFQTGSRSLLTWAIKPILDQMRKAMREG